jgi:hypothetical protein
MRRSRSRVGSLGLHPKSFFEAGVLGALCDEPTRDRLRRIGEEFDWRALRARPAMKT